MEFVRRCLRRNAADWMLLASCALSCDVAVAQSSATYTYDALGRVKTVTDSTGTATYTYDAAGNRIQVNTVPNRSPAANADSGTVAPGGTVTISVLANDTDPDGDALTVSSASTASKGTVTNLSNAVRYVAGAGQSGQDSFTYTVSDQRNGTATGTVSITIAQGNRAPVAAADSWSTAYQTSITSNPRVNDSDPDGDALTIIAVGSAANGSTSFTSTSVTYTPASGFSGSNSFSYTISDGRGGTATANITVSVAAQPNQPPSAVADSWSTAYGTSVTADPRTNDSDPNGDALTVVAVGSAANGSTSFTSSSVTYAPASGFRGLDAFSYTISDGRGNTASSTINVNVAPPPNQPPIAVTDSFTVRGSAGETADGCYAVLSNDSDPDGQAINIASFTQASSGTVYQFGNQLCYTAPTGNYTRTFTYTISDGAGGTATATVTVTVRIEI